MKNHRITILILGALCLFTQHCAAQYNNDDILQYIEDYKEVAIYQMYEHKIPASITLAQGIFESACGTSRLAREGKNHFGIKCHKDWQGDTILIDDDELQECFRKYTSASESYDDHAQFLIGRPRYQNLFTLDLLDYEGWAKGLKAAGYATNPKYAERLISLIQRFNLAQWDTVCQQRIESNYFVEHPTLESSIAKTTVKEPQTPTTAPIAENTTQPESTVQSNEKTNKKHESLFKRKKRKEKSNSNEEEKPIAHKESNDDIKPEPIPEGVPHIFQVSATDFPQYSEKYPFTDRVVYVNNKTLFVIAKAGDTYASIAKDVQDKANNLRKYNDVSGNTKLYAGQVVYIERKEISGKQEFYTVKEEETLHYISQVTAVKLKSILRYNKIDAKKSLQKGDIIKLKR